MSAIVQQLTVADQLIEQRMKFEDLLVQVNRLPPSDLWPEFEQKGSERLQNARQDAQKALSTLFNELINIENLLDKANPGLLDKSNEEGNEEENEEEPMDQNDDSDQGFEDSEIGEDEADYLEYINEDNQENADDEQEEEDEEDEEEQEDDDESDGNQMDLKQNEPEVKESKRLESDEELNEYLLTRHDKLNSVRNEILEYWFQKTRFTLKGGKLDKNSLDSFEQSTIRSIEFALQNRLKLIRRTQLKRSKYQILGRPAIDEEEPKSELVERKAKEIYDSEIFDDSDFYHQLLRELIGNLGPSTTNSSTKVNPKWLKLMKERFKTKKNVDTKATKARKIRYKVHDELVNFMTPMLHLSTYNEQQKDHLFSSLFGNRPTVQDDDEEDEDLDSDDE